MPAGEQGSLTVLGGGPTGIKNPARIFPSVVINLSLFIIQPPICAYNFTIPLLHCQANNSACRSLLLNAGVCAFA